jgi:GNAT superfamily N-acetyltransferase
VNRIRALRPDDLPQVSRLYEHVMRSGGAPPPGLTTYFDATFLQHPWADEDVPSLVHESGDGTISGFLGSHVRRLRFDGRAIRMGCSGQLVVEPAARRRGVGALLLRHYLAGPQDLTITDGATGDVRLMWERLGGHTAFLRSMNWTRVFKPWHVLGEVLLRRSRRDSWKRAMRPVWSLLDTVTERVPRTPFRVDDPPTRAEPLTPSALLEQLPAVAGHLSLCPDYDQPFTEWLFEEMAKVSTRGNLVRCLVRDQAGRVLGWYVAYLQPGGISQVMQVAAVGRDVEPVLDHLFHHAQSSGTAALQGRLEPLLFETLTRRRCLFRQSEWALIHARDPEIVNAVLLGRGMLTRMEGEWWMGHHIEPFTSPPAMTSG